MRWLLAHGLTIADAEAIPALAELALGVAGDADDCVAAVEHLLLDDAFDRLARYKRFTRQQLKEGLAELLGIRNGGWSNQGDRFDNAAKALTGYTDGESFRHTKYMVDGIKKPVWLVFLEMAVAQLVSIASETHFSYSRRFVPVSLQQPKRDRITKRNLTPDEQIKAQMFIGPLLQELRRTCDETCRSAVEGGHLPMLVRLAEVVAPQKSRSIFSHGSLSVQGVEHLLQWAVYYFEPHDRDRRQAIFCLLGVKGHYWQSFESRRRIAEEYLIRIHTGPRKYRRGEQELRIFTAIARLLAELFVQEGIAT